MTAGGWHSLSVRRGLREPEDPFEGMPPHLQYPVSEWLRGQFGWFSVNGMNHQLMAAVASSCRIPVRHTYDTGGISGQILAAMQRDEDLYMDCVDATLHLAKGNNSSGLREILKVGGSVWTVREDGLGLERRVPEAMAQAYSRTVAVTDTASEELRQAWAAIFGRNPDPSDGWDHTIKAVEEVLIPIVVPKATKPNLGTVAGELKANPGQWCFGLPSNGGRSGGETLEGLIRHIWPNPDRHGGAGKRSPTLEEAEAAVQLGVAIVGVCRGRLAKV